MRQFALTARSNIHAAISSHRCSAWPERENVQVICVTYSTNDLERGDVVLLAGGYSRIDDQEIMLDRCLPYEAP